MIKPLHPTLKACKCGFIGSRAQLYKHLTSAMLDYPGGKSASENHSAWYLFFKDHGESVLNADDPRLGSAKSA